MMYELMMWQRVRFGELLLFVAGVLFLANVWIIATTGDFRLWSATKALYAFALILLLFDR